MPDQPSPGPAVAATYFQPPLGYFWRWAEGNEVVEWLNGTTITYREELAALLAGLAPDGLPPLGAVLLLLAACHTAWKDNSAEIGLLQGLLRGLPPGGPPDEELQFHLRVATAFLDIVAKLPLALRQGTAKEHLLREVLGGANTSRRIPAPQAQRLAADLAAYDEQEIIEPEGQLTRWQVAADLRCFDWAARKFPTVHGLELRLRTGLDELLAPLAAEELPPPPPAPEPPAADLLAELAQETQTAGLARLVPHLQAALHLPQPARQAGDQPLGGVADLSNRGPLDRLLLSELAQDDLSLLARLAHGEALYLRREAPPLPQPPPRVLLLDTTLQMWGLPRVVGLAAALALALPASGPSQPPVLTFALGGHAAQPLDLRTRPGVVAALGHLDPALHCGAALPGLLPTLPAPAEAMLITEAHAARQPEFLAFLHAAPPALRFLLTVARSGELTLVEVTGGRHTVLSTSRVALEEVLFPPRRLKADALAPVVLPAFLQQAAPPLFFPTVSFQPGPATMHYQARRGAIGVTQQLRVLFWPYSYAGAIEALPVVEEGEYHFGFGEGKIIYLLVVQKQPSTAPIFILYTLDPWKHSASRVDLSDQLPPEPGWAAVSYQAGTFLFQDLTHFFGIDCQALRIISYPYASQPLTPDTPAGPRGRDYFNPGYGTVQQIKQLSVSPDGLLLLGKNELVASADSLLLRATTLPHLAHHAAALAGTYPLAANPRVRLQRWAWPDGSEAFVDSRGLLHLRSAAPALPEVTVVLATNRATAAWAAGGYLCGWSYFTGLQDAGLDPNKTESLPAAEFYATYIQPFIDHLR